MNRQIKMFRRVVSKWDPILSMLFVACLVLISLVAADQMYIDDQMSRLREPSSLKNSSSYNVQIGVESTSFKSHFNIIKESENQSVKKVIENNILFENDIFPNVPNSDFNTNNNENSLSNEINNGNKYTPINKTQTHKSSFESYQTILSLLFDNKTKYIHEPKLLKTKESTETHDNVYNGNQKTIAPIFSDKSNLGRRSKASSNNKTEVPWEIQFAATDRSDHSTWRAYFYDQAIAVMLQDDQEYVYNCTLIEVIKLYEQRQALQRLGKLMPLVPVSMPAMVHLITLCGSLDTNVQKVQLQNTQNVPMWWMSGNLLRGLMPGTLWCGMGDAAENYHQLGYLHNLDNCCRAHDHCPIKLRPLMNRYGLTNLAVNTKSHCSCDLEFFRCLKSVGSEISKKVGEVYFNYLQVQCIDEPSVNNNLYSKFVPVTVPPKSMSPPSIETPGYSDDTSSRLKCIVKDVDGGCRMWIPNPKSFTKKLVIKTNDLVF